jgi:hypothetical protein
MDADVLDAWRTKMVAFASTAFSWENTADIFENSF